LLNCLDGLLPGDPGTEIRCGDVTWQAPAQFIPSHQRNIGFVFQDARLFPHLNVSANLAYAEKRRGGRPGPGREEVCSWLRLTDLLQRMPQELSSGQQQRVAIARALLSAPDILFLDEPLANIDQASRSQILDYLELISRELSIPMLYVSHDIEELARLAENLVVMAAGRITAQGPMVALCSRLELALAHEEQAAAIVTATLNSQDTEFGLTQLDLEEQAMYVTAINAAPGAPIRLRVPARDVSLCRERPHQTSILNVFSCKITEIENTSSNRLLLRLQLGEQFLLARITRKSLVTLELNVGDEVFAQVKSVALLSQTHE